MRFEPPLESERARARRTWLASPAIATALFFAAQIFVAVTGDKSTSNLNAAAADAPSAIPVAVRVVTQIRNLDDTRVATRVPNTEAQLLELLDKRGCIVFSPQEVEKIGTQEASFEAGEVGVITADKQIRRATYKR